MIARHFACFLSAARHGNFQRAAHDLHITPSALSRHIIDLEYELGGVKLFQRQARGVTLTSAGQSLLEDAARIMDDIDRASARAARLNRGETGTLRVGFVESFSATEMLGKICKNFLKRCPNVELRLIPMHSLRQREHIEASKLEVGFMFADAVDHSLFLIDEMVSTDLVLGVPSAHRLAKRRDIQLADLKEENFIWPSIADAPGLASRMSLIMREKGIYPKIIAEASFLAGTFNLISHGVGIGFFLSAYIPVAPASIVARKVKDFSLPLTVSMVRARKEAPEAVVVFCQIAKSLAATRNN